MFVDTNTALVKESSKKAEMVQESSSKRAGDEGNTKGQRKDMRLLWGDLKVMSELDVESEVWRNLQGHKVTVWKLFYTSGVHFVRFQNLHIFMLVEEKYPTFKLQQNTENDQQKLSDHWNEICYQLLKLMTKQLKNPGSV
ncbi:hypothetical protein Tco_0241343 [Tanacetum coccineum]